MLQKLVLDHFSNKFKNPTYKEWVALTGIEQTRLFRIRNGSPIKVNELETFISLLGDEGLSLTLYFDCFKYLDNESLISLEKEIRRKITISKLLKEEK